MQNPEVFSKMKRSSFGCKTFVSCTGEIHECQGYEPIVLEFLDVNSKVLRFTTVSNSELLPTIEYSNPRKNGKRPEYYPDIGVELVDGRRLIIEVKSEYHLWREEEINRKKFRAASAFCRNQPNSIFLLAVVQDRTHEITWKS